MKLKNGLNITINKSYYNRAIKGDDNVYVPDVEHRYPLYELEIYKNYRDVTTKEECINKIIADLKSTIKELKNLEKGDKEI